MKKYIKPELYFESFTLSQHIADCALEWKNNTDMNSCFIDGDAETGLNFVYIQVFTDANSSCLNKSNDLSDIQGYCNTNSTPFNTFQS